ncbi:DNA-processing protein DprA [Austwickia chelonae]|uniref:DNA-processing protein DprA n=1 Tax=Austwickia chelonae TaxID=100225 RepID=UPI000E243243|nr:DNA-processing protein DprA [Austwickia chelonae]
MNDTALPLNFSKNFPSCSSDEGPDPSSWPAWPSSWGRRPDDDREARAAWARIAEPGDAKAHRLISRYGALAALRRLPTLPEGSEDGRFSARLATLDIDEDLALLRRIGGRLIVPDDPEWPQGLNDLERPPHALWVRGPLRLGQTCRRSVAVVGARASTPYGEAQAAEISAGLAERGFTIVSGAACGIDAAAHRGTLAVGGTTVAVLAGGVDRPYPAVHAGLIAEIASSGAVISETAPGAAPMRQRFLLRNRIIAAMASGTLVVEAGLRSGSRNTAGTASGLHRPVMAVPGPVTSMSSAGCHEMVRAGMATLVTDAAEVAEEVGEIGVDLAPVRKGPERPGDDLDELSRRVLDALSPRHGLGLTELSAISGLSPSETRSGLGQLSLTGLAAQDAWGWRRTR